MFYFKLLGDLARGVIYLILSRWRRYDPTRTKKATASQFWQTSRITKILRGIRTVPKKSVKTESA